MEIKTGNARLGRNGGGTQVLRGRPADSRSWVRFPAGAFKFLPQKRKLLMLKSGSQALRVTVMSFEGGLPARRHSLQLERGAMRMKLGRYVYGAAAVGFGVITLVWREFSIWQQNVPHLAVYLVAVVEILGGLAIFWKKT